MTEPCSFCRTRQDEYELFLDEMDALRKAARAAHAAWLLDRGDIGEALHVPELYEAMNSLEHVVEYGRASPSVREEKALTTPDGDTALHCPQCARPLLDVGGGLIECSFCPLRILRSEFMTAENKPRKVPITPTRDLRPRVCGTVVGERRLTLAEAPHLYECETCSAKAGASPRLSKRSPIKLSRRSSTDVKSSGRRERGVRGWSSARSTLRT